MSWTPKIWIRKSDFELIKSSLQSEDEDSLSCSLWEFNIGTEVGVVISAIDSSHQSMEIHEMMKHVPHWLLSSEYGECNNCNTWGNEIDLSTSND